MEQLDMLMESYFNYTNTLYRQLAKSPVSLPANFEHGITYYTFVENYILPEHDFVVLMDDYRSHSHTSGQHSGRADASPYHRHEYFEMFFVGQGSCSCYINGEPYLFTENQCCIMNLNTVHSMEPLPDSSVFNIIFKQSFFDETFVHLMHQNNSFLGFFLDSIYSKKIPSRHYIFDILPGSDSEFFIHKILTEYIKNPREQQTVLKSLSICLLNELSEQYKVEISQNTHNQNLSEIISYIWEHCQTATLENTAFVFHYTPSSLGRLIRKNLDCTFSDILRRARLKNAYLLLSATDMPIQDIALRLGYSERGYFEKTFKRHCGISPAEYRKKHLLTPP